MLKKTFIFIIDVENICETFFRVIEQIVFTNIGNIINIFTVTFWQFNASLLNKIIVLSDSKH